MIEIRRRSFVHPLLLAAAAILAVCIPCARAAAPFADEWVVNAGVACASEELFRGLERSGHAAEASLSAVRGGFRASAWTSRALQSREASEVRGSVSWTQGLGSAVEVELRGMYFGYSQARPGSAGDSFELGVKAAWPLGGWRPTIAYFRDLQLGSDTVEGALEWSLPLTRLGAYVDGRFFTGWSAATDWRRGASGAVVRGGYGYAGIGAEIPYRVGEHVSLVAGVDLALTSNASGAGPLAGTAGDCNLAFRLGGRWDF